MSEISLFLHSRKGAICGRVVREDDEWLHIELARDHELSYASNLNRGRIDEEGEVITVRKSLVTEIGMPS